MAVAPLVTAPAEILAAYGLQIWRPFCIAQFVDPLGNVSPDVEVLEGTLTHDSQRWPRTTAELVVASALRPADTRPPVSAYGGQVRITVGAQIGPRRYSYRAATLDVFETAIERPSGRVEVSAVSREARVNEDRYITRDTLGAGTVSSLVTAIVRRTIAGVPVRNQLTQDIAIPAGQIPLEGDVWPTVEAVMNAGDAEAVFNAAGELVLRVTPVRASTPALVLSTAENGVKGGTMTNYRSVRGWGPNKTAQIYLENDDEVAAQRRVGIWEDTGATAGTGTSYGRHTEVTRTVVDAGKLPLQATADRAALALARRHRGAFRSVTVRAIPAPWLTPGDTVQVSMLGGASERLLVRSVSWPLNQLDVMQIDCVDPDYVAS